MSPAPAPAATWARCRLCKVRLKAEAGDDLVRGVCRDCVAGRPGEVARLPVGKASANGTAPAAAKPQGFTEAERALIRAMHGYLPAAELLRILNERRTADRGAAAVAATTEQLHQEVQALAVVRDHDWTALRQLLAQARGLGLLAACTPDVLEDFAVVFALTPGQVTHLRDVIGHAQAVAR